MSCRNVGVVWYVVKQGILNSVAMVRLLKAFKN